MLTTRSAVCWRLTANMHFLSMLTNVDVKIFNVTHAPHKDFRDNVFKNQ